MTRRAACMIHRTFSWPRGVQHRSASERIARALQRGRRTGGEAPCLNPVIAYCGPAAVPEDFWLRWNGDPLLLAALAALALAVGRGHSSDARAGWGAIALMVVVFVSPLCALASALFSARVLHHVLLIAAVAPLLAVAFPLRRLRLAAARRAGRGARDHPVALARAGALCLGPRQRAGLLADAGHAARQRLAPVAGDPGAGGAARPGAHRARGDDRANGAARRADRLRAAAALLVHLASTAAWGLSPLADQQLGGLLMWVPAILPYLGVGLWLAWSSLRPGEPAR